MKGEVLNKLRYPRSYLMETGEGIKIRRNRRHFLKTRKTFLINPDIAYENVILLEDIPALHGQHPYRTTRSDRQVIIP